LGSSGKIGDFGGQAESVGHGRTGKTCERLSV
jgi:hypothetical protein